MKPVKLEPEERDTSSKPVKPSLLEELRRAKLEPEERDTSLKPVKPRLLEEE